jgi:predicted phosphodiesterase
MAFAPIPDATKARVRELAAETHPRTKKPLWSQAAIGAEVGISKASVCGILKAEPVGGPVAAPVAGPARMPDPAPEAGGPSLPDAIDFDSSAVVFDAPGKWVVMGDHHIPYHSPDAIRAAVDDARRFGATGVLLNGDVLDFYALSNHYREPDKGRVKDEIERGREFLRWLRSQFPGAAIQWKYGNHDERLRRYLAERAPELFDLDDLQLDRLMRAADVGVGVVGDKRVVMLGKLAVVHGHEYRGGGGVQPSRWLYLRTGDSTLTNHFHRTDHYTFRTVTDREVGMWSVGCLCHMKPAYMPLNQWSQGWALVEVSAGGRYTVTNRQRLQCGRVV